MSQAENFTVPSEIPDSQSNLLHCQGHDVFGDNSVASPRKKLLSLTSCHAYVHGRALTASEHRRGLPMADRAQADRREKYMCDAGLIYSPRVSWPLLQRVQL